MRLLVQAREGKESQRKQMDQAAKWKFQDNLSSLPTSVLNSTEVTIDEKQGLKCFLFCFGFADCQELKNCAKDLHKVSREINVWFNLVHQKQSRRVGFWNNKQTLARIGGETCISGIKTGEDYQQQLVVLPYCPSWLRSSFCRAAAYAGDKRDTFPHSCFQALSPV